MNAEEAWQELLTHAEWSQGPWLGWIFAEAEAPLELLRGRLTQLLKERDEELRLLRPSTAEEANHLLENLFAAQMLERGGVWLTLVGRDAAWEQAWRRFHHLLNERRERLMRHLRGPLIIVGPPGWKEAARDAAPDLWTLRTVLLELDPIPSPLPFSPMPLHLPADADAPDPELAAIAAERAHSRRRPAAEAEARLDRARGLLAQGEARKAHLEAERAFTLADSDLLRARALAM